MTNFKRVERAINKSEGLEVEVQMRFSESDEEIATNLAALQDRMDAGVLRFAANPDEVVLRVEGPAAEKQIVLTSVEFTQLWKLLQRLHKDNVFDREHFGNAIGRVLR